MSDDADACDEIDGTGYCSLCGEPCASFEMSACENCGIVIGPCCDGHSIDDLEQGWCIGCVAGPESTPRRLRRKRSRAARGGGSGA